MELLTGKCKEDFEGWYYKYIQINRKDYIKYSKSTIIKKIYRATLSMQYGVLIDFFDSVGKNIHIEPKKSVIGGLKGFNPSIINDNFNHAYILYNEKNEPFVNRTEARIEAIKKANELYNLNK